MKIKAKIIGNQIWTAEDISLPKLKMILSEQNEIPNITIPARNEDEKWVNNVGPCCCSYNSSSTHKKSYLFNRDTAEMIVHTLSENEISWRIPTIDDWVKLFQFIDKGCSYERWNDCIALNIRSTYGWPNNGTNKIGFNAYPNFKRNENGLFNEELYASWWVFNNRRSWPNDLGGISLYSNDVVAEFVTEVNTGLAIRLVRNLSEPRPEEGIVFV